MRKRKKLLVFLILIILIAIGIYFRIKTHSKKEEILITEKVKRGELLITVEAEGVIVPNKKVDIKSKIQGGIKKLFVEEGNRVNKGDIIAQIEEEEFQARYNEASANLEIAKAELEKIKLLSNLQETQDKNKVEQAGKNLQQAKLRLDEAERNLLRIKQLKERELISQSEVDSAQTSFDLAKSQFEEAEISLKIAKENFEKTKKSNEQELRIAHARIQQAEASLKFAKENLNYTTILSPISGVVTYRGVEVGDMVASETYGKASGTTIVTISDLSSLFVETKIDEVDIGMIKLNQDVDISVEAFPNYEMKGEVFKIGLQSSTSEGITSPYKEGTSTFFVKIKILNPLKMLKPGMNCNVDIIVANLKNTLYIPIETVVKEGKKQFVEVKTKDKKLKREIKTGMSNPNFIQITDGLKEGEEIVIPTPKVEKKRPWED